MGPVRTTILAGAVALGLGLTSVGFGVAYLVIAAYHPWPEFPSAAFRGHPELGILFVAGGVLAYGEGVWSIRSWLDPVPALLMTVQNTVLATTESRAPSPLESPAGPCGVAWSTKWTPPRRESVNLIAVARLPERRGPHRDRKRR